MRKQYLVHLSAAERADLDRLLHGGIAKARRLTRARILLLADAGQTDREIVAALRTSRATVERTRRKCCQHGVAHALDERPRPGGAPLLDDAQSAVLVAVACSAPPAGVEHWTLQRLADRLVALGVVDAISDETVRRALKKTISSRGASSTGASRP